MARIETSIWLDPDWRRHTAEEQVFLIVCRAVGSTGACTDKRITKYTGWTLMYIAYMRTNLRRSKFTSWMDGNPKRRKLPRSLVTEVKSRDGAKCQACNTESDLQIDHIIPVALGGSDDIDNLQVLCRPCNQKKGVHVG